jgi:hypothetical protein
MPCQRLYALLQVRPFILREMRLSDCELDKRDPKLEERIADILADRVRL